MIVVIIFSFYYLIVKIIMFYIKQFYFKINGELLKGFNKIKLMKVYVKKEFYLFNLLFGYLDFRKGDG